MNFPKKYIPKHLSKKDKLILKKEIIKTRKNYKKNKYLDRRKVRSYKPQKSKHVIKAMKLYNISSIKPSKLLAHKTKCSIKSLKEIENKGRGAWFSGSRPNQNIYSWGIARLASSITGGKSSAVDFYILKKGCKKTSKALKLATQSLKKYKKGTRKVPKITL